MPKRKREHVHQWPDLEDIFGEPKSFFINNIWNKMLTDYEEKTLFINVPENKII
jgi:hypothetical protein